MIKKFFIVGIVIVFLLSVFYLLSQKKKESEVNINLTPTPTDAAEAEYFFNEVDGAPELVVSEKDQKRFDQMVKLRDKGLTQANGFTINFDYSINKFKAEFAIKNSNNINILKNWLVNNGYGDIPLESFILF